MIDCFFVNLSLVISIFEGVGWEGGDVWVREQFRFYLNYGSVSGGAIIFLTFL
jgi:hypothetical protein